MKQVLESLESGSLELADVPCPRVRAGHLLIRTRASVISVGTERMMLEFGKANLLQKARQQPDKVRQTLDKIKTDGLAPTLAAVRTKLSQPIPLGYCNAGVVLEVGEDVRGFRVGQRVASNGNHAEVVCVPKNLCAPIPDGVEDEAAAFAVLGAIALQGVRLVAPTLGEAVVVTGLGLLGQLTVQLLRANGCRVLGIDPSAERCALARTLGAETVCLGAGEDPILAAQTFSRGRGVDAVLVTASTRSSEPISQAATMCRKRGRIVLVGVTGLELSRADFFEKELTFQVSCSYGPGRYDPAYEEGGQDYPLGFVRWTEQRNLEAFLDMVAAGAVRTDLLVTHSVPFDEAARAYAAIDEGGALGIVLRYPDPEEKPDAELLRRAIPASAAKAPGKANVAVIGSGNYATAVLLPALKETGASLVAVASAKGVSATQAARKFGFAEATTDSGALFDRGDVNTLILSTRHDSHAAMVCRALRAGKHVFVEKPLAIRDEEVDAIEAVLAELGADAPLLMVGFNRRFAPHVLKMKELLAGVREPKAMVMTVNAGAIPEDHWTQDPAVGGGRVVGEGCHFVDLMQFVAGARVTGVQGAAVGGASGALADRATWTLTFDDGSMGTIHYLANGHRSFPKERFEVFAGGRVLQLDNFRNLAGFGWPGFNGMRLRRQDKGNAACLAAFIRAIESGSVSPIPPQELLESARATLQAARAVVNGPENITGIPSSKC
ncbi:MAG: bi-domain-containing oxidoreductase [Fimbriimonadaceae bacterium]|nr:bi-domain-containing oxidoreductase [Chthonomonadaceae bacterium]MCO5297520.1 bi-domain-containing oxidoreductase [Fimbriimonadaceae bacterium]